MRENKKIPLLLCLGISALFVLTGIVSALVPAQVPPLENDVIVNVTPDSQTGVPGDTLTYTVNLTNNGTVSDIIVVAAIKIPAGWTVELKDDAGIVSLPYNTPLLQCSTSYNLSLGVHIPKNASSITESMYIEIHSYADSTKRDNATLWCVVKSVFFDTGNGTYPSISGTHKGVIKLSHDVTVNKLYTYPCKGTGGHSEYAKLWNVTWNVTAHWTGYRGDWHNITFDKPFTLEEGKAYNYEIKTGSYPQIIHKQTRITDDGIINCTSFVDANGNVYNDGIPAIRLG